MYKHLTQHELYYIWLYRVKEFDLSLNTPSRLRVSEIAINLNKHRSTIYRAVEFINKYSWTPDSCNKSLMVKYTRNKINFKIITPKVSCYIADKLKIGWSPEVISGRIKKELRKVISFKTIYRYIHFNRISGGKLFKLLPHKGKRYKYGSIRSSSIANRVDISARPAIVEAKIRLGDLEGDTVVGIKGGDKSCLLTLVDRVSKYCLIRKLPNKTAQSVEVAMADCYDNSTVPFITVTYDNGTEFANHLNISEQLGCNIYFARPYRSCDRGLNEHTNGLIRRFFPKKTDFGKISHEDIIFVQNLLNDRPRKSLKFLTPNEVVNKNLTKLYKKLSHFT